MIMQHIFQRSVFHRLGALDLQSVTADVKNALFPSGGGTSPIASEVSKILGPSTPAPVVPVAQPVSSGISGTTILIAAALGVGAIFLIGYLTKKK